MRSLQQFCSFLLLCLFFFFTCPANAQHVIEGHVNNKNNEPLSFASVFLQSAVDSTVLQTTLTDSTGRYYITVPQIAYTVLKVSTPGYQDQSKLITDTIARQQTLNFLLGNTSKNLSGIIVSGKKPLIERKIDRTIFNVESSAAIIGGDALEAIKRAPGVRVTNNDIGLVGKSSVQVLLNDKLVQLSGDELIAMLKSIPAENLARIEVITTPPAKYDAAGNAGLINIVTKKMMKNGLNGQITPSYTFHTQGGYGVNGSFNYRKDKLNVYGIGNAYHQDIQLTENMTTNYTDEVSAQNNETKHLNIFNRVQVGADYNLNERSVIGILYTLGNGSPEWTGGDYIYSAATNITTGRIDSFIITNAETRDRGLRNVVNLNYEWKIDTNGKKLSADLDFFNRTGKKKRDFTTTNFYENGTPTGIQGTNRSSGVQEVNIRAGKIDITWPTHFAALSFGGKASFIHNTSNNLFEYLKDSLYHADPTKTNEFDYKENTQAIYFSAQKTWGKWDAQIGLRGEYTQTTNYSPTLATTTKNDYFKIFPTVYLQYKPNEGNAININYSKRIDRPSFWDMNPFRYYFTATSYEQGNPFLQPSFNNNIELGYVLKSDYSFTLYAQLEQGVQSRVSIIDTINKSYSFNQQNIGKSRDFGAIFNATLHPFKWWESTLQFNGFYAIFRSDYYGNKTDYSRPACNIETNNNFTLNKSKTLLAELNFNYNSKEIDDFDIVHSTTWLGAGIRLLLLQKQLTLGINAGDLLKGQQRRLTNQYNGTTQNNYYDDRFLRFAITWKFGNNNIKEKRERSTNEDAQRAR